MQIFKCYKIISVRPKQGSQPKLKPKPFRRKPKPFNIQYNLRLTETVDRSGYC